MLRYQLEIRRLIPSSRVKVSQIENKTPTTSHAVRFLLEYLPVVVEELKELLWRLYQGPDGLVCCCPGLPTVDLQTS